MECIQINFHLELNIYALLRQSIQKSIIYCELEIFVPLSTGGVYS